MERNFRGYEVDFFLSDEDGPLLENPVNEETISLSSLTELTKVITSSRRALSRPKRPWLAVATHIRVKAYLQGEVFLTTEIPTEDEALDQILGKRHLSREDRRQLRIVEETEDKLVAVEEGIETDRQVFDQDNQFLVGYGRSQQIKNKIEVGCHRLESDDKSTIGIEPRRFGLILSPCVEAASINCTDPFNSFLEVLLFLEEVDSPQEDSTGVLRAMLEELIGPCVSSRSKQVS